MKLKYKIQHYLTITDRELNYLIVLCSVLFFGIVVRVVKQHQIPDFSVQYAALDSLTAIAQESVEADRNDLEAVTDSTNSLPSDPTPTLEKVNINTANSALLTSLPGIGPAMASRIIDHRERYGHYRSLGELKSVRGIGDKTFQKLRPLVTLQ